MPIAEIGSQRATVQTAAFGTTTVSFPGDVTVGSLIVLSGGIWAATANTDIAVTKNSGTATIGTLSTIIGSTGVSYAGGVGFSFINYGRVTATGSLELLIDPTVAADNYISASTAEFPGVHFSPLDVNDGETLTGPTDTHVASITTLSPNALIIGALALDAGIVEPMTAGTGYTQLYEDETPVYQVNSVTYRIVATPGAYDVDWTGTSSLRNGTIVCVAFKELIATAASAELAASGMVGRMWK